MPNAKLDTSSTGSSRPTASTIPPNIAAMFGAITPEQLSTISSQLGMTSDERSRVSSAMRDPDFLQLLSDYAREMSDPEVKRRQEEVLRKMEQEAGVSSQAKKGAAGTRAKQSTMTSETDID